MNIQSEEGCFEYARQATKEVGRASSAKHMMEDGCWRSMTKERLETGSRKAVRKSLKLSSSASVPVGLAFHHHKSSSNCQT